MYTKSARKCLKKLLLPILLSLFEVFLLIFHAYGASETFSKTRKDTLTIHTISPRTNTHIFTPSSFRYSIKILYTLQTMDRAYIMVNVYKLTAGGKKETCLTTPETPIHRGSNSVSFSCERISLRANPARGDKLLCVISLLDEKREEIAYTSSLNYLAGEISLETKKKTATRNYLKLLSAHPQPGTSLKGGIGTSFKFKFAYNVLNSDAAFALLQFSSVKQNGNIILREYYIPVPEGRGTITVNINKLSISEATRGEVLGVLIPFSLSPGAGEIFLDTLYPYNIAQ